MSNGRFRRRNSDRALQFQGLGAEGAGGLNAAGVFVPRHVDPGRGHWSCLATDALLPELTAIVLAEATGWEKYPSGSPSECCGGYCS